MEIANADGDAPTIVADARSIGAESVPGWDQPFTDQELDGIEAAISRKRRSVSGAGNGGEDRPGGHRRRLPGSFSSQRTNEARLAFISCSLDDVIDDCRRNPQFVGFSLPPLTRDCLPVGLCERVSDRIGLRYSCILLEQFWAILQDRILISIFDDFVL